jgi:hypothetical protein
MSTQHKPSNQAPYVEHNQPQCSLTAAALMKLGLNTTPGVQFYHREGINNLEYVREVGTTDECMAILHSQSQMRHPQ